MQGLELFQLQVTCAFITMQFLVLFFVISVCCLTFVLSEEWDIESFQKNVLDDEKVWLVEFYSTRCGGCVEFSDTWTKIEASMQSIATTKVNIDFAGSMELAQV